MQGRELIRASILICGFAWACRASGSNPLLTVVFSGSANGIVRSCHCPNAPWGGLAKRAWLMDQVRSEAGADAVIAIDAGDLFPVDSSSERSALMMRLLSVMNYDAIAIGDQELRDEVEFWITVNRDAGFWNAGEKRSSFPWLSGGYRLAQGNQEHQRLASPWKIVERNGLKVGIVSVVGPAAWRFAPSLPEGVSLTDPAETVSAFLEKTRDLLDVSIVLSHQGLEADRELAERIRDVDLIIGGHSQSLLSPPEVVNGIAICQAGKNGENLGLLVMTQRGVTATDVGRGDNHSHVSWPAPDDPAGEMPFLPSVVETRRWRIAQQILPLTTAIEDDATAAGLIDAYYAAIDAQNAERAGTPASESLPEEPQITVTWPDEPIRLSAGEHRHVPLRIANRGGALLRIERVRSKSPWMEVLSFPNRILPGEEDEAILEVTAEKIDRLFRCEFSILTNDPQRRVVQGAFSGRVEGHIPGILDVKTLWANLTSQIQYPIPENMAENPSTFEISSPSNRAVSQSPQRILVDYFYAPGCSDCREIEENILPQFTNRFAREIDFRKYDVTEPANYLRLASLQERLSVRSNEPVSIYIDREIPLLGITAIREKMDRVVSERLAKATTHSSLDERSERSSFLQQEDRLAPGTGGATSVSSEYASVEPTNEAPAPIKRRLEGFTVPAVMLAGLVDGVNPCAFAAIVFFITLLSVSGVKAGRLLLVGAGYTLAVFATYLLMGFGAFRLLQSLHAWQWLANALRWVMIALLAVLALLSFRDAWAFRRSGRPGDIALQLPNRLKRRMHEVMRKRLNPANLFLSALIIGCLVTVIEAICTGQVYLPTLVLMSRYAETRARALPLLLLYNLMCVIPLVIVTGAAFFGTRNQRLLEWSKRNVIWGKVLMGLLFVGLASALLIL